MCLYTKQTTIKKAYRVITAYKMIVPTWGMKYLTPYSDTPIPNECLNGERLFKANGRVTKEKNPHGFFSVCKGLIHCFCSANDALKEKKTYEDLFDTFVEVWEVTIPKGTLYYEGSNRTFNGQKNYAAKQIRFVKRLEAN